MQVSTIWCHLDPQHALERPRMAIRVPGEFHEASSRMLLAHWSSPQRLPVALPHCTCPLRWDDALARWTPLVSTDNGEMPFPLNIITFIIICPSRLKMQKDILRRRCLFCADGETRTHTGQRPLPPQSSVSTISPRPQYFGTAKLRTKIKKQNFFEFFFVYFCGVVPKDGETA